MVCQCVSARWQDERPGGARATLAGNEVIDARYVIGRDGPGCAPARRRARAPLPVVTNSEVHRRRAPRGPGERRPQDPADLDSGHPGPEIHHPKLLTPATKPPGSLPEASSTTPRMPLRRSSSWTRSSRRRSTTPMGIAFTNLTSRTKLSLPSASKRSGSTSRRRDLRRCPVGELFEMTYISTVALASTPSRK